MKEQHKQFNFGTILKGFLAAFNVQRGIIATLRDLLISPVLVMNEYIEGKIDKYGYNKYFSPGRFFVTVLAILSVFAFFSNYTDTDLYDGFIRELSLRGDADDPLETSIRIKATSVVFFFLNNPMFGFLLLIIPSALSTRFVFRKNNYNLAKHFVVNTYCFCFIALFLGVFSLFFNQQEYLMYSFQKMDAERNSVVTDIIWKFEFYSYMYFLLPVLYYTHSFKNVFKLSWVASIIKTLVSLFCSYFLIFFVFLLLTIIIFSL